MDELPIRKRNRLKGYDYSEEGAYFLTVCVNEKRKLLGEIIIGTKSNNPETVGEGSTLPKLSDSTLPKCVLSKYGVIVENNILSLSKKYPSIYLDIYVIMPNHIHILLVINKQIGERVVPDNFGRVDPALRLAI